MAVRIYNGVYSLFLSFFQHYKTIVLNLFLIRSETFMTEMKREKKKSYQLRQPTPTPSLIFDNQRNTLFVWLSSPLFRGAFLMSVTETVSLCVCHSF